MKKWRCMCFIILTIILGFGSNVLCVDGNTRVPHRILLDTDVDKDDISALLYLLKLNRSRFHLEGITINTNSWSHAGHAVNHIYDILYMMDRDDVSVGVGGEGGITKNGRILSNVGGYLPIIEQGIGTAGYCRYRQVIPAGTGGSLDSDTDFGFRKSFLPQGIRRYYPIRQPTVQQVLMDKISAGPIHVLVSGASTNIALFLMKNPHLKKNIEHIYLMGGSVKSKGQSDCRALNVSTSCCNGCGNLYTAETSNPYAEFNFFLDPFAAYQMMHSGIPVTLVPLDATNSIPINSNFFEAYEMNLRTFEAQYSFNSLKMARDTWFDDQFYEEYFMWDPFMIGVATSMMENFNRHSGENDFAEMEYMNLTVVTSNEPYGVFDGSNPFFDGLETPKYNLKKSGVHSGHVQTGLRDPFCSFKNGTGRCMDGYTAEITGEDAALVLVATRAKPSQDGDSYLNKEFYKRFLDVLNRPQQCGRFNFTTQFPNYNDTLYMPDLRGKKLGINVVFDMDMSIGDFIALFYILKVPVEKINLKAIFVSPTGWANAGTIDVVYDILHMMGRDDIPVGLGDMFPLNQEDLITSNVGDCKYTKAIPHGSGGFLDSDTLYGFARDFPRSPRRYTAENSVKFGAPRDTDHPELRQPLATEIWENVSKSLIPGSRVTILTNGPLTNLAKIILSDKKISTVVEDVYIVGGHINYNNSEKGNVINVPSNEYAEMNMFLDPLAAKTVLESQLNITFIPLSVQRKVSSFPKIIERLRLEKKTPEAVFVRNLISRLQGLQKKHHRYKHMEMFLGEILGAVILSDDTIDSSFRTESVKIYASGDESEDGQIIIDAQKGKAVKILEHVDVSSYYDTFVHQLGVEEQSAVLKSFEEQKQIWSTPRNRNDIKIIQGYNSLLFSIEIHTNISLEA